MRTLRIAHTVYGFTVFTLLFVILFPFLLIPIFFPSQFNLVGIINRWWAKLMFVLVFLPYKVDCRAVLDPKQTYIFCPNHFSFLDIPTLGLNPINALFIGKSSMAKLPLFGFMYRKLHLTVDRKSMRSRADTVIAVRNALDQKKSLVIYPEGGMLSRQPPGMADFKDGAFRAAIEKQIPIVPVTIPFNWIILPDQPMILHRGNVTVIFHEPIETKGLTLDDTTKLKTDVFAIIESELKKQNES